MQQPTVFFPFSFFDYQLSSLTDWMHCMALEQHTHDHKNVHTQMHYVHSMTDTHFHTQTYTLSHWAHTHRNLAKSLLEHIFTQMTSLMEVLQKERWSSQLDASQMVKNTKL